MNSLQYLKAILAAYWYFMTQFSSSIWFTYSFILDEYDWQLLYILLHPWHKVADIPNNANKLNKSWILKYAKHCPLQTKNTEILLWHNTNFHNRYTHLKTYERLTANNTISNTNRRTRINWYVTYIEIWYCRIKCRPVTYESSSYNGYLCYISSMAQSVRRLPSLVKRPVTCWRAGSLLTD